MNANCEIGSIVWDLQWKDLAIFSMYFRCNSAVSKYEDVSTPIIIG